MSHQHFKFLERLRASKRGELVVAAWLAEQGYGVEVPPTEEAPTAAQAPQFSDRGDVFFWNKDTPRRRVEVKTLTYHFTCRADWPFGEIFIGSQAQVDRAGDEPYAWISLSPDFSAIAIVKTSTKDRWYLRTVLVKNTGNYEIKYAAPLECVKFVTLKDLPSWLERL